MVIIIYQGNRGIIIGIRHQEMREPEDLNTFWKKKRLPVRPEGLSRRRLDGTLPVSY